MFSIRNDRGHNKTYKVACATSEDSDQPGHPPSLIRVFSGLMELAKACSYLFSSAQMLIRLGGYLGGSESSREHAPLLVLLFRCSKKKKKIILQFSSRTHLFGALFLFCYFGHLQIFHISLG